jgi:hypothetical protein
MASQRDPLSVDYDPMVRDILILAIRRHRNHQRGPIAWIASPRREFRELDRGGRTRHERAFTRSAYYQVFKVPRNTGQPVHYSLVLEWDEGRKMPAPRGQVARSVRVQIYKYGKHGLGQGGTWRGFQSTPGDRIDS